MTDEDRPEPWLSEWAGVGGGVRLRRVIAGEGLLKATHTFTTEYNGRQEIFEAGRVETRVHPEHEIAVRYPERFTPAMPGDHQTREIHRELLQQARARRGWRAVLAAVRRYLSHWNGGR